MLCNSTFRCSWGRVSSEQLGCASPARMPVRTPYVRSTYLLIGMDGENSNDLK